MLFGAEFKKSKTYHILVEGRKKLRWTKKYVS